MDSGTSASAGPTLQDIFADNPVTRNRPRAELKHLLCVRIQRLKHKIVNKNQWIAHPSMRDPFEETRTAVKILKELIHAGSNYTLLQLILHPNRHHQCSAFLQLIEGLKTVTRTVSELSDVLTNYPTVSKIKN